MSETSASVTTPTPSAPESPIRVIGRLPLQLSDEEKSEFERLCLELAALTRQHDQVTSYSCNADIEDHGVYVFDEVWPSYSIFQRHLETSHFKRWWSWVEPRLRGELAIDYTTLAHLTRL